MSKEEKYTKPGITRGNETELYDRAFSLLWEQSLLDKSTDSFSW